MPPASIASRRRPTTVGLGNLPSQAIDQGLRQIAAASRQPSQAGPSGLDFPGRLLVGTGGNAAEQLEWLTELTHRWQATIVDGGTAYADSGVDQATRLQRLSRCDGRQLAKELRRCRSEGSLEPLRKLLIYGSDSKQAQPKPDRLSRSSAGRSPQPDDMLPATVLIDRLDQATSREDNQLLICQLIDAVLQTPTLLAVTLPRHPTRLRLHPLLESRLTGGLVLPLGPDTTTPSLQPAASPKLKRASQRTRQTRTSQPPTVRQIIAAVARYHSITVADILGGSQRRCHVRPRGLAIHLIRQLTGKSTHAIGLACGGRDHTTVLHSLKVTARLLQTDPSLAGDLEAILTGLQ